MKTISKDNKKRLNNDSTWESGQNLDDFFSTLAKIKSSGVSAIITKEEKKESNERNQ